MKKLISAATAAALSLCAFCSDFSIGFKPEGAVSSYTKTVYTVTSKFGDYFRTVFEKETHTFANGLETDVCVYSPKDELLRKHTNTYDSESRWTAFEYADFSTGVSLRTEFEYAPDETLRSETVTDANSGALNSKSIFKHENTKCTENLYDADGKLVTRIISSQNESGKTAEEIQYNGDGTLDSSRKYAYTEDGKNAIVEQYSADGTCTQKIVFRYDAASGFLTEIQVYNQDNKLSQRRIYKNDAFGNPVRISCYDVSEKFGTTVNELTRIEDFSYVLN